MINDNSISRQHGKLYIENKRIFIQDSLSKFGTYKEICKEDKNIVLQKNVKILINNFVLEYFISKENVSIIQKLSKFNYFSFDPKLYDEDIEHKIPKLKSSDSIESLNKRSSNQNFYEKYVELILKQDKEEFNKKFEFNKSYEIIKSESEDYFYSNNVFSSKRIINNNSSIINNEIEDTINNYSIVKKVDYLKKDNTSKWNIVRKNFKKEKFKILKNNKLKLNLIKEKTSKWEIIRNLFKKKLLIKLLKNKINLNFISNREIYNENIILEEKKILNTNK